MDCIISRLFVGCELYGTVKFMKNIDTRHFWELLEEMTKKELIARYKYTFFGFLWIILNPILQMLIIGFVFRFFIKEPIQYYFHFLFIGLLVWNFFSLSLTKATPCIVYERALIKKAYFQREVLPLSIILSNFFHLIISMLLFLIAILLIGKLTILGIVLSIMALFLLCVIFQQAKKFFWITISSMNQIISKNGTTSRVNKSIFRNCIDRPIAMIQ